MTILDNAKIFVKFEKYNTETKKSTFGRYFVTTEDDGTQICDGRVAGGEGWYWSNIVADPMYDTIKITVYYSSNEFGSAKQSVTLKPLHIPVYMTLKSKTQVFNPEHKNYELIKIDGLKIKYDKYGMNYELSMEYNIYKNNKLIYKSWIYSRDGGYYFQDVKMPTLDVGTYKIIISDYGDSVYSFAPITSTLKITKAKTTVKAPKLTAKFKKSKYFKITVKYHNKGVKKVKIKVKVYTGKKSKSYIIKTNNAGVAKLNTKNLKKGKHKVVISSPKSNYEISAKSQIIIK